MEVAEKGCRGAARLTRSTLCVDPSSQTESQTWMPMQRARAQVKKSNRRHREEDLWREADAARIAAPTYREISHIRR